MLAFIDEAGDTGFKFDTGSSRYFTIGMVVFEDREEATLCDQRISLLRKELSLKENYEFHFKKDSRRIRKAFIQAVSPYEFFYYCIVVDKTLLRSPHMQIKDSFYKYSSSLLFENAKDKLENAIIIIDRQGGKTFEKQFKTYIQRKMNSNTISHKRIKKLKMEDSHRNNLLQLADYIASGTHRLIDKPSDATNPLDLLSHREIYTQIRPKGKSTSIPEEGTS